ncbi:MAG: AbrB/MazE/SpoVT family DNA-binding domain-containing protein [Clostridia bacterium]|nr:AbrB/MazE/SpoVT family DNA-binding domain-containing protein [Clostridia bacterium]
MKSTGIKRAIDALGRIVLPIELRHSLGIEPRDYVEIYVEKDSIILRKAQTTCLVCGAGSDSNILINGKIICKNCLNKIKSEF